METVSRHGLCRKEGKIEALAVRVQNLEGNGIMEGPVSSVNSGGSGKTGGLVKNSGGRDTF